MSENNIKNAFDNTERIGVIGSPSSTGQLTIDILGTATNKRLVGSLSIFNYNQDGQDHYALGQIVEIMMQNTWAQDPTIRGLIRKKGRIDPISERQDTHVAKMTVSSVFANKGGTVDQSILGTVPSTGTSINLLNEEMLNSLLADYEKELFYLGLAYGTNIKMPMWFKHFGSGNLGAGEAYHIGIFGKTGSGKSILAKMIMLAYSRHKSMSIFVLDPQGEFAKDLRDTTAIKNTLEKKLARKTKVYDLHSLVLTGPELFKKILASSDFFKKLKIFHEDNRERAANQVEEILNGVPGTLETKIPPYEAHQRHAFNRVWNALNTNEVLSGIYSTGEYQDRVRNALESANPEEYYQLLGQNNKFI